MEWNKLNTTYCHLQQKHFKNQLIHGGVFLAVDYYGTWLSLSHIRKYIRKTL